MWRNTEHISELQIIILGTLIYVVMYIDNYFFSFLNVQGRVIPCDFIGVVKSQQPVYLKGT